MSVLAQLMMPVLMMPQFAFGFEPRPVVSVDDGFASWI